VTSQGLASVIDDFRASIGLDALAARSAVGIYERLRVPAVYSYSSSLIPRPADWPGHISAAGFSFLDLATGYTPPDDLAKFLAAGPPPVYCGFGSVPMPPTTTQILLDAVKLAGVRALLGVGWSSIGEGVEVPDDVLIIRDVPHDWLFADGRVAAVCHHGGAGVRPAPDDGADVGRRLPPDCERLPRRSWCPASATNVRCLRLPA